MEAVTVAGGVVLPETTSETLLPAYLGHVARGRAPPPIPADAIEPFLHRVAPLYRRSRKTRREHGFLAYAPRVSGAALVSEDDAEGTREEITWHWEHRHATVAFTFHTHPGRDALCRPSGMDALGALVRGDHVLYVMTMDGRLSGWKFRDPRGHPAAVDAAMRGLEDAGRFGRGVVGFLYDAFESMILDLMEPAYAARVTLDGDAWTHERCRTDASFFRT